MADIVQDDIFGSRCRLPRGKKVANSLKLVARWELAIEKIQEVRVG
jgi:hypothetical protein